MENVKLNTIEEAIEDFKAGNFVIVVDDEDCENEGDLIIAAEKITPEKVNFLRQTALLLSRRWPIRLLLRPLSGVLATLIHCMLRRKVCCAVPDIRRLLLIWHVWLDFIRREPLWK